MGYIETKLEQAPQLITQNKAIATAYKMALENLFQINTVPCDPEIYNKSGLLDNDLGLMMRAGGGYPTPWTRDAAVNTMNAGCFLEPEVSKNTLWAVAERVDGKLCFQMDNQCWDKVIWATGAWKYYLATKDVEFLADAYETVKNSVEMLEKTQFNEQYGLFTGGSFFNDGITGYPKACHEPSKKDFSFVGDHEPAQHIMSFSTNCLYYNGYRILERTSAILGKEAEVTADFAKKADKLKEILNRVFWSEEKGTYAYIMYPDGTLEWYQEGCGISFAMLFDVCDAHQVELIMKNCYRSKYGLMSIWPPFEGLSSVEKPIRHNNLVWVVVNGYFMQAIAKWGYADILGEELETLAKLSIEHKGFWEIYNGDSGEPDGGWQVGTHWGSAHDQTWSATGFIAGIVFGIFGITLEEEKLVVKPCLPKNIGNIQLKGIKFRNVTLDIELKEMEDGSVKVFVNGEETDTVTY